MVAHFSMSALAHFSMSIYSAWAKDGNLGLGFALMAVVIFIAMTLQLTLLRPTSDNKE